MPLFSVIIPIYNSASYLNKCIESVIYQSYEDWELILINDGSNDLSGMICEKYASSDNRILVTHQVNSGVSVARNKGISIASGKYIMFVDADDWLENNCFSYIVEVLQIYNVEMIQFGYYYFNPKRIRFSKSPVSYRLYETLKDYSSNSNYGTSVWGYLFLRQIVLQNGLLFNKAVKYAEDQEFVLKYFFYVKSVFTIDKPLYNYNDVPTSAMNKTITYSRAQDTLSVLDIILGMYKSSSADVKYLWNTEIQLLLKNYYRTISQLSFSIKLVKVVEADLKKILQERKLEVVSIFKKQFSTNPFFIIAVILYYKIRIAMYQIKIRLS